MKHLIKRAWNKLLPSQKLVLVEKKQLQQYKHQATLYNHMYRVEDKLILNKKLGDLHSDMLKALLYEIKSTKNALLIEQKRYSDPIEIAFRDGAISTIDILLLKIMDALRRK